MQVLRIPGVRDSIHTVCYRSQPPQRKPSMRRGPKGQREGTGSRTSGVIPFLSEPNLDDGEDRWVSRSGSLSPPPPLPSTEPEARRQRATIFPRKKRRCSPDELIQRSTYMRCDLFSCHSERYNGRAGSNRNTNTQQTIIVSHDQQHGLRDKP